MKKISEFFTYLKWVSKKKEHLESEYRLRVDNIGRLYTVINMPNDVLSYGTSLAVSKVEVFIKTFGRYLQQEGMNEYIRLRNVKIIDEINYLVVFGYSVIDQLKMVHTIIVSGISIILIGFLFYFKLDTSYYIIDIITTSIIIYFINKKTKKQI